MPDQVIPGGIVWSPHSEYAKERRKWESYPSEFGPAGRPAVFTEFPQMLYKAKRNPNGGPVPILEHCIVHDENERRNMQSRGFCIGPDNAVKAMEQGELDVAVAAAERASQDRWMSESARKEAEEVDVKTIQHLGEISSEALKEAPEKRGPGRPRKAYSTD